MADNPISPELLEPALPGAWIAERHRIWQMNLLTATDLARFCDYRGLADFGEKGIIQLWQLGLLKADLVESDEELSINGLVPRGVNRYGTYIYSDERQFQQRPDGWKDAAKILSPLRNDVELLFHPFRFYVLYHLNRVLGVHIHKMQVFKQESMHPLLDLSLSQFNQLFASEQFIARCQLWNAIVSLAVVTEPCTFVGIFESIKYDPSELEDHRAGAKEIEQHIDDYWHTHVEKLYRQIGTDRLEQIRRDLCFDTQVLDPNSWIHTLLCLGKSKLRLELEGHLGGALLMRTMAEMLRRATEVAFATTLREEDELGKGSVPESIKETLYGSRRLLDDPQAASVFVRMHGLNYKSRVHLYVEGATEYGAFKHFFKLMGLFIPVIDLHGLIKSAEGEQMLTFIRESLQTDIQDQVYSIVMIDGDREENVRAVVAHARTNQTSENEGMFGRFFIAHIDFEFANFEIEELEEILWEWVAEYTEMSPSQEEYDLLHEYVKDARRSKEFFDGVGHATRFLPQLSGFKKGKEWGAKLMDYALEHRVKQYQLRQIIEAAEFMLRCEKITNMERYDVSKKTYMIDLQTGKLIPRPSRA